MSCNKPQGTGGAARGWGHLCPSTGCFFSSIQPLLGSPSPLSHWAGHILLVFSMLLSRRVSWVLITS